MTAAILLAGLELVVGRESSGVRWSIMIMSSELGPWRIDYRTNCNFDLVLTLLHPVEANPEDSSGLGKLTTSAQLSWQRGDSVVFGRGKAPRVRGSSSRQR